MAKLENMDTISHCIWSVSVSFKMEYIIPDRVYYACFFIRKELHTWARIHWPEIVRDYSSTLGSAPPNMLTWWSEARLNATTWGCTARQPPQFISWMGATMNVLFLLHISHPASHTARPAIPDETRIWRMEPWSLFKASQLHAQPNNGGTVVGSSDRVTSTKTSSPSLVWSLHTASSRIPSFSPWFLVGSWNKAEVSSYPVAGS
jgi:hypothetical protein